MLRILFLLNDPDGRSPYFFTLIISLGDLNWKKNVKINAKRATVTGCNIRVAIDVKIVFRKQINKGYNSSCITNVTGPLEARSFTSLVQIWSAVGMFWGRYVLRSASAKSVLKKWSSGRKTIIIVENCRALYVRYHYGSDHKCYMTKVQIACYEWYWTWLMICRIMRL